MIKQNRLNPYATLFGVVLISTIIVSVINPNFFLAIAQNKPKIGADAPPYRTPEVVKQFNNAIVDATSAVIPTVVSIAVESEVENQMSDFFKDFHRFFGGSPEDFGGSGKQKVRGAGSGVIISSDGYIVTNNHVVENATKGGITVTLNDKSEYKAEVVGTDPSTDLAVIKIDANGLKPAFFGDMTKVKPGDFVIAVGNPLGLSFTVTQGIVSAIGRGQLGLPRRSRFSIENFIQTDAAINPGNSGGGLFDLSGALIGINTAIATETGGFMGYGFAIPVDIVKTVIDDLIEDGKIDRPSLGVMISNVDKIQAKALGLDKVKGVLINDLVKKSGAEEAGLEPQDVILKVDGVEVNSVSELQTEIIKKKIGDKVTLTIWRDNKEITKKVTLKARDEQVASNDTDESTDEDMSLEQGGVTSFPKLGFSVKPLTNSQKDEYEVDGGVFITNVNRSSVAAMRGMAPNGVIVSADRQTVKNVKDLKKIINGKKSGDAISMKVKYSDSWRVVSLEIP